MTIASLSILAWLSFSPLAGSAPDPLDVAEGLVYYRHELGQRVCHVLRFDLKSKKLRIRSVKAKGTETLRQLVDRFDDDETMVIGGINGDFFRPETEAGIPFGLQVCDGRLVFAPMKRSVIGFRANNEPFMGIAALRGRITFAPRGKRGPSSKWAAIDMVNPRPDEYTGRRGIFLFTPAFLALGTSRPNGVIAVLEEIRPELQVGEVCEGRVARFEASENAVDVPENGCLICFFGEAAKEVAGNAKPGQPVAVEVELPPFPAGAVSQAIGGGPRLVRDGRPRLELEKEDFGIQAMELSKEHPRAAIGFDAKKSFLYLVQVEGRRGDGFLGITLGELAAFMKEIGCHQAMGFDGGGSAAMYVAGKGIVSKGEERKLANALLLTMPKGIPKRKDAKESGPAAPPSSPSAPREEPGKKAPGSGEEAKEKKEEPKDEGKKGEVKPWDP